MSIQRRSLLLGVGAGQGSHGNLRFSTPCPGLGVAFSASQQAAATLADELFKRYRAAGGQRGRMVADFLIGAHAPTQCDRLLSRDRSYARKHVPGLAVLDPSA